MTPPPPNPSGPACRCPWRRYSRRTTRMTSLTSCPATLSSGWPSRTGVSRAARAVVAPGGVHARPAAHERALGGRRLPGVRRPGRPRLRGARAGGSPTLLEAAALTWSARIREVAGTHTGAAAALVGPRSSAPRPALLTTADRDRPSWPCVHPCRWPRRLAGQDGRAAQGGHRDLWRGGPRRARLPRPRPGPWLLPSEAHRRLVCRWLESIAFFLRDGAGPRISAAWRGSLAWVGKGRSGARSSDRRDAAVELAPAVGFFPGGMPLLEVYQLCPHLRLLPWLPCAPQGRGGGGGRGRGGQQDGQLA